MTTFAEVFALLAEFNLITRRRFVLRLSADGTVRLKESRKSARSIHARTFPTETAMIAYLKDALR